MALNQNRTTMFHQVEGMVIDKGVTMADLKGTLNTVVEQLYGKGTKTRFRPHHFPFTEPSCEMDVQCHKCGGVGCPTCKGEGWIELLGAGMIHPRVLEMAGIDPSVYSGWAFGIGLGTKSSPHHEVDTDVRNGSPESVNISILFRSFGVTLERKGVPHQSIA